MHRMTGKVLGGTAVFQPMQASISQIFKIIFTRLLSVSLLYNEKTILCSNVLLMLVASPINRKKKHINYV